MASCTGRGKLNMNNPMHKISSSLILFIVMAFTVSLTAESFISAEKLSQIESNVNSMSVRQLNQKKESLIAEQKSLNAQSNEVQSTESKNKISKRLAEINAELSAIQKALIAILGVGAISALTSDDYNDEIPPVITINGDNPVTVELGGTYSDAGATALDAYDGAVNVSASGNVDTSKLGSLLYALRDQACLASSSYKIARECFRRLPSLSALCAIFKHTDLCAISAPKSICKVMAAATA